MLGWSNSCFHLNGGSNKVWHGGLRTQMGQGVLSCPPQASGTLVASHPLHQCFLAAGNAKDGGGGNTRTIPACARGPWS